jgi:putative ABC transport system ATP-binding protein
MAAPILRAKNLSKHYGSGQTKVRAVKNVSLDVLPGEIVLIMGPSGSGKTTLLLMLGGLLRPTEGNIEINEPKIILADEPTGNLDSQTGQEVMMILYDIARDDECSVVLVTHDPRVEEIADRIF